MSDNFATNPGSGGETFASDDIGGVQYPRIKLSWGADGVAVDVSGANPLPTSVVGTVAVSGPLTDAQLRAAAVPVSGPLTDAQLRATPVPVSLTSTTITGSVAVTGTFWQATQPVSAASLPLPTGAATSALQTTGNTSLSNIDGKLPALSGGRVPVVLPAGGSGLTDAELRATPVPVSTTNASIAFAPGFDAQNQGQIGFYLFARLDGRFGNPTTVAARSPIRLGQNSAT